MTETLVTRPPSAMVRNQRSFRDAMGRYPTGVVLVAAETEHGPVGMAVNSFTSVSLDPPLVSFCPMITSTTWAQIREVGSFSITFLRDHHEDVSRLFARHGADKFGEHDWQKTPGGHPILADALGWIDASIAEVHVAGDHHLVIANAKDWSEAQDGSPLVFFTGGYAQLASAV